MQKKFRCKIPEPLPRNRKNEMISSVITSTAMFAQTQTPSNFVKLYGFCYSVRRI